MKTIKNIINASLMFTISVVLASCGGEDSTSGGNDSGGGTAQVGSTAKIVILGEFLITLSGSRVETYEIKEDGSLLARDTKFVTDAETLFTYSSNLVFMGTETGAEIFELNAEGELLRLSFVDHTRSCDPVVANDKYMFLTLRSGDGCRIQNGSDQLQVYNIEDIENPVQVHVEPINQPQGLALAENDTLYVCYSGGLKQYDITTPANPVEIADYTDLACNDLIYSASGVSLLTSDEKINLVDLSDITPTVLSSIAAGD